MNLLLSEDLPLRTSASCGGYQPNTGNERRYGMNLSVKGVVA